jgi:hypothetical protein
MTNPSAQTMLEPLLTCPFCGVAPFERFEININGPKYPDHWFVWCENLDCKAGGEAMEETQVAARAAWNTRTASAPASMREALTIAQKALEEISDAHGKHYSGKFPRDVAWSAIDHIEKTLSTPEVASSAEGKS